jgi:mRNA interferase RelE/StbE
MEVRFKVIYEEKVVKKDIPLLHRVWKKNVQIAISEKLTLAPHIFAKSLQGSLKGYRSLRVGDYRVIFRIAGKKVLIFAIIHRSEVYERMQRRI